MGLEKKKKLLVVDERIYYFFSCLFEGNNKREMYRRDRLEKCLSL